MGPDRRDGVNRDSRAQDSPRIGSRLGLLSARIGELTSRSGLFYVACARTAVRPAPVADQRFGTRRLAEEAAECASRYRAVLRELDPSLPVYDLVANEATSGAHWLDTTLEHAEAVPSTSRDWEPVPERDRDARIDYCHAIAGAVLESLSERRHDTVERVCHSAAVRDGDADDRCLRMLEALDAGLDRNLTVEERRRVLQAAAGRLAAPSPHGDPFEATLERFRSMALLESYEIGPRAAATEGVTRPITAKLSGYAWGDDGDGLPTFPIVVDLYRRCPDLSFSSLRAVPIGDGSCRIAVPEHG